MADRALTQPEIDANVRKANAEADFAIAAAEEKLAAAREHDADVKRSIAEEKHMRLLLEHSGIENKIAEIALAKCEREESFDRVSDLFHKVYTFSSAVEAKSVRECITTLTAWSRQAPGCDIDLIINSPGGDILAGFALVDFLLELRHKGHKITTIALGIAASMAAVVLQAGDVRVMGPNAILLLHEGSLGVVGSWGEAEDRMVLMTKLQSRIFSLFAERAMVVNPKTTVAFLRKHAKRTDWFLTSDEAVALGLVDAVR